MKQWLINLMRRLDRWEARMGSLMDHFEWRQVRVHLSDLEVEVHHLDNHHADALRDYDRDARVKRDNFIAKQQIEAISKRRELATVQARMSELSRKIGYKEELQG